MEPVLEDVQDLQGGREAILQALPRKRQLLDRPAKGRDTLSLFVGGTCVEPGSHCPRAGSGAR
jgi:hypothetical protein